MHRFLNKVNVNNQYFKYKLPFIIGELYLINFKPKSNTTIHGHNGNNCYYLLLNGSLHENRYKKKDNASIYNDFKLKRGKIYHINDNMGYHQLFNNESFNKYSLHYYL